MSEINLLAFGCAVTFIAIAGAYVYLRESFLASLPQPETQHEEAAHHESRVEATS